MDSLELTKHTVQILDRKKAEKIDVIKIDDVTTLGDCHCLCYEYDPCPCAGG